MRRLWKSTRSVQHEAATVLRERSRRGAGGETDGSRAGAGIASIAVRLLVYAGPAGGAGGRGCVPGLWLESQDHQRQSIRGVAYAGLGPSIRLREAGDGRRARRLG